MTSRLIVYNQESGYFHANNIQVSYPSVVGGRAITFSTGSSDFTPINASDDGGQWHYPDGNTPYFLDNWELWWTNPPHNTSF